MSKRRSSSIANAVLTPQKRRSTMSSVSIASTTPSKRRSSSISNATPYKRRSTIDCTPYILKLNEDCLNHIFKHLDVFQALEVRKVCKSWFYAAMPCFRSFDTLSIDPKEYDNVSLEAFVRVLRCSDGNVKRLILSDSAFQARKNQKMLSVVECSEVLKTMFMNCRTLKYLEIRRHAVLDRKAYAGMPLKNLTTFVFVNQEDCGNERANERLFNDATKCMPNLDTIKIRNIHLSSAQFLEKCFRRNQLKCVELEDCTFMSGAPTQTALMHHPQSLVTLVVTWSKKAQKRHVRPYSMYFDMAYVDELMQPFSKLEEFVVTTTPPLQKFLSLLQFMPNLKKLGLSDITLQEFEGNMKFLKSLTKVCPKIEHFDYEFERFLPMWEFPNFYITDGFNPDFVKSWSALTTLRLHNVGLEMDTFVPTVWRLTSLESLYIVGFRGDVEDDHVVNIITGTPSLTLLDIIHPISKKNRVQGHFIKKCRKGLSRVIRVYLVLPRDWRQCANSGPAADKPVRSFLKVTNTTKRMHSLL